MKPIKVKCSYCNGYVLKTDYNHHSGPCYHKHFDADGIRKKFSVNKKFKAKKASAHQRQSSSRQSSVAPVYKNHETARPFFEDGSRDWGYVAREQGRYGSHATFDDYSEDSWA